MKITKTLNGDSMEVILEGRLDTESAPVFESELKDQLSTLSLLTLDFSNLEYISSAGLRVLVKAKRGMKYGGVVKVKNANEIIREVFEVTGLTDIDLE